MRVRERGRRRCARDPRAELRAEPLVGVGGKLRVPAVAFALCPTLSPPHLPALLERLQPHRDRKKGRRGPEKAVSTLGN